MGCVSAIGDATELCLTRSRESVMTSAAEFAGNGFHASLPSHCLVTTGLFPPFAWLYEKDSSEKRLKWLERESTDRKVRGSNPASASRIPLSRFGQPGSILTLVLLSGGMAVRHRKGATAERLFIYIYYYSIIPWRLRSTAGRSECMAFRTDHHHYRQQSVYRLTTKTPLPSSISRSLQHYQPCSGGSCGLHPGRYRQYPDFSKSLSWLYPSQVDHLPVCATLNGARKTALLLSSGDSGSIERKSFSYLSVPNRHATRRKHEDWDTVRLPRPRQGKSKDRGRVRTTDLPVDKFAL
ncbi:hypothetical protein CSKR_111777 [Clonorchis sinensis]|uniref:Uncharacterized protein n=1 Tax=Clonorchis sinensis TaxID=79923 RepID=A0A419PGZ5_CLOSI|nr:hypothetical protein CSKR_111777 [Clonorchis sinensis]